MDSRSSLLPCEPANRPDPLSLNEGFETLGRCVWDAFVLAFLVQIFGSIVIGLVGGLWREMIPSLPPVFASHPSPEAAPSPPPASAAEFHLPSLQPHRFGLLFALFLVSLIVARFARRLPQARHRAAAAKLTRVLGLVSDQWFYLIVGNAFTAFVDVMVLGVVQHFTLSHWIWSIAGDLVRLVFGPVLEVLSSTTVGATFARLSAWFQANQTKFIFWLLYSAAICDDLGLPN